MSSDERLKILFNFYDNEQYTPDLNFLSKIEQLPENKLIKIIFKKKTNQFNILEATDSFLKQLKNDDLIYKKKYKKRKLK